MAVYGSKADAFKLKNQNATTTVGNTTVIGKTDQRLGSMATANAMLGLQNKPTSTPTKVFSNASEFASSTATPAKTNVSAGQTTTSTPTAPTLPVFGTPASQQNTTNPTYLDTRNTDLAKQYGTQGLKTQDQVMAELLKNQDFATASETDRNTTATEIFKKMNVGQTTEPVQVKTDDMASDNKQYATTQEAEADNPRTQNLSAEEKIRYNMMDDIEKKQFINYGRADLRNALQYLARRKETRDYNEERGKSTLKQQELSDTNASIQSGQRLRQSEDNLNKLKANVKYLGTMGAPGVSMTKMDAINGQITEAQRVFDELREMEKNSREMRELGYGDLSAQIERQMVLLQDDLDDKVNKSIQNAFSMMSAEEIKGGLDTVEEIDAFRTKLMTNLDNSIGALTDDNIKARQFLIERFDNIAKEKKTYIENSNKVNTEMSTAKGYYVDGNGSAILDQQGATIPMPEKPMYPPAFNDDKSMMITFDAQGNPSKPIQLFEASEEWKPTNVIVGTDEFGNKIEKTVLMNKKGQTKPIGSGTIPTGGDNPPVDTNDLSGRKVAQQIATDPKNIANIAADMVEGQQYDCGTRGQCGEWYNDATGRQTPMGDTWDSKKKYIDYGITEGEAGMGVVFNPGGEYVENGHVGMLASGLYSKNGVMGYDVVSANYDGNEKLSKDFIPEGTIAKNGGFIPLKATAQADTTTIDDTGGEKASVQDIYQVLTESGIADGIAKKNAKNLASKGMTLEQVKAEYPTVADKATIKEYVTNVSTAAELFDKSNNKLTALEKILAQPNISGKSIEVALKSFVSSIDNTAAMAGEVEQARNAGTSKIEEINNMLLKLGDGNVSEQTKTKIKDTINEFANSTREAFDDYLDTKYNVLAKNYGEEQAKKLNLYKRNKKEEPQEVIVGVKGNVR